jgi:hypothetical protein
MSRVLSRPTIARSPEEVFSYVTTPGHWPEWRPASLGVTGATDHSLLVGEEVRESFLVAGRRGRAQCIVAAREEPGRRVILGQLTSGVGDGDNHGSAPSLTTRTPRPERQLQLARWVIQVSGNVPD